MTNITPENVATEQGLLHFVNERENVRTQRSLGKKAPWTEDEIIAKYKFTNVRRRDDRVSQWIINNIIEPNLEDTYLWFKLVIARLVNWPPTLAVLESKGAMQTPPSTFNPELFSKVIEDLKLSGAKVYSGAYMIYPTGDSGGVKSLSIANKIIGDVVAKRIPVNEAIWKDRPLLSDFVFKLSSCYGISTFIAGQVAADLTYAKGHLDLAEDLYTYAPIGPGSSKGLNYLLGRSEFASWKQDAFNAELIHLRKLIIHKLGDQFKDMTLHDVQNCMCEFSKYVKAVKQQGNPKSLYKPETEF